MTPKVVDRVDDLVILESEYGSGLLIHGHHVNVELKRDPGNASNNAIGLQAELTEETKWFKQATVNNTTVEIGAIGVVSSISVDMQLAILDMENEMSGLGPDRKVDNLMEINSIKNELPQAFWTAEEMGVESPRRCEKCRGSEQCGLSGQIHTEKEALE